MAEEVGTAKKSRNNFSSIVQAISGYNDIIFAVGIIGILGILLFLR